MKSRNKDKRRGMYEKERNRIRKGMGDRLVKKKRKIYIREI